jgi:hypothetical protein
MINKKMTKERIIENHLRYYNTYKTGIKNCEKQLEYILPTLVPQIGLDSPGSYFYIPNNTQNVALDRLESKRTLDLKEEIERYKIIVSSIESSLEDLKPIERKFVELRYFECLDMNEVKTKLGYSEERSVYRIRRHCLDKLLLSLVNLLTLK